MSSTEPTASKLIATGISMLTDSTVSEGLMGSDVLKTKVSPKPISIRGIKCYEADNMLVCAEPLNVNGDTGYQKFIDNLTPQQNQKHLVVPIVGAGNTERHIATLYRSPQGVTTVFDSKLSEPMKFLTTSAKPNGFLAKVGNAVAGFFRSTFNAKYNSQINCRQAALALQNVRFEGLGTQSFFDGVSCGYQVMANVEHIVDLIDAKQSVNRQSLLEKIATAETSCVNRAKQLLSQSSEIEVKLDNSYLGFLKLAWQKIFNNLEYYAHPDLSWQSSLNFQKGRKSWAQYFAGAPLKGESNWWYVTAPFIFIKNVVKTIIETPVALFSATAHYVVNKIYQTSPTSWWGKSLRSIGLALTGTVYGLTEGARRVINFISSPIAVLNQYNIWLPWQSYEKNLMTTRQAGSRITEAFNNNKELVLEAVKRDGRALKHASLELKGDNVVAQAAVEQDGIALEHASNELKKNKKIVLAAVKQGGTALQYASDDLKKDREIVQAAIEQNGAAIKYANKSIIDDALVKLALPSYGLALQYGSDALKQDSKVVQAAIKQDGAAIQYADASVINDDLVKLALPSYGLALQYGSAILTKDSATVFSAVQQNGAAIKYVDASIINDDLVQLALPQYGLALQYGSAPLKNDTAIVQQALKHTGLALAYASDNIKNIPEFVKLALDKNPEAMQFASKDLKQNADFILEVIESDEFAEDEVNQAKAGIFKYIDINLQQNNDFMQQAFEANPFVLKFVSKEMLKAILAENGMALEYVSTEMKKDKEIIDVALANNPDAAQFIDNTLQVAVNNSSSHMSMILEKLGGARKPDAPQPSFEPELAEENDMVTSAEFIPNTL